MGRFPPHALVCGSSAVVGGWNVAIACKVRFAISGGITRARVRGIDIFLAWGKTVGIEIDTANLLLWCRKHPFVLLHRFYTATEQAGIRIKNCARIWGLKGVFRHVFIGFKRLGTGLREIYVLLPFQFKKSSS